MTVRIIFGTAVLTIAVVVVLLPLWLLSSGFHGLSQFAEWLADAACARIDSLFD